MKRLLPALFMILLVLAAVYDRKKSEESTEPTANTNANASVVCEERSASDHAAAASLIVSGTVFAVIPGPEGADVLITPDEVYKGTVPETGIVVAAREGQYVWAVRNDAAVREVHFATGQPAYLLYLTQRSDGRFLTSVCDGSRFLGSGLTDDEAQSFSQPAETMPAPIVS